MFSEEISEIKKRGFRVALVIIFVFLTAWNYSPVLISRILKLTTEEIITISPIENIQTEMLVSSVLTALVVIPYLTFETFRYTSPALEDREKKFFKIGVISLYGSFMLGFTAFAYCLIKGTMLVLDQYSIPGISQSMSEYSFVSFVLTISVACGFLACIPCVISTLTYFKCIKSEWLTKYWKQVVVGSMVISAIVSPGVDIFSMLLFEVPVLMLFGVSVLMSKFIESMKNKNIKGVKICSVLVN
jgi:sec-independent protein translocase protein TatC